MWHNIIKPLLHNPPVFPRMANKTYNITYHNSLSHYPGLHNSPCCPIQQRGNRCRRRRNEWIPSSTRRVHRMIADRLLQTPGGSNRRPGRMGYGGTWISLGLRVGVGGSIVGGVRREWNSGIYPEYILNWDGSWRWRWVWVRRRVRSDLNYLKISLLTWVWEIGGGRGWWCRGIDLSWPGVWVGLSVWEGRGGGDVWGS